MTPVPARSAHSNVIPIRATEAPAPAAPRTRRRFGKVSKLRSGRLQASYVAEGERHLAPVTFQTLTDANAWLAMRQAELLEHRWKPAPPADPSTVTFGDYGKRWIENRDLGPRTRAEYARMFDGPRVTPLHSVALGDITPAAIKAWFETLDPDYPTARKRAYGLVHAILTSATRQEEDTDDPPLLASNPARLSRKTLNRRPPDKPAKPKTRIRPATLDEINTIVGAIPERYRAMVLLATWAALRFGELTELRRKDVFLSFDGGHPVAGVLHVSRAVAWPKPDMPVVKGPKSEAGIRDVHLPPHILDDLVRHIDRYAAPGDDGLLFPAVESGGHMKHGALYKVFRPARAAAGRPDLRWHDLRHTGATLAAQAGASLGELMGRMGHSTVAAALIYQHAGAARDAELARKLSAMTEGTS